MDIFCWNLELLSKEEFGKTSHLLVDSNVNNSEVSYGKRRCAIHIKRWRVMTNLRYDEFLLCGSNWSKKGRKKKNRMYMRHIIMLIMKPYSKRHLQVQKWNLLVVRRPNVWTSALSEASIMSLIEFKDEIMGITRDSREDATTSIFEASYPKIELRKVEKDEKLWRGLHDETNRIFEASHLNANLLGNPCEEVKTKEVQN